MGNDTNWKKEAVGYISEASAIVHYFSILEIILSTYNLIYGQDNAGTIIAWLAVMLFSSVIAELLKSKLPTFLRITRHQ